MSNNVLFNTVRVRKPGRNLFDLSHENKFTCGMGQLIPFLCEEVVPGDTFSCNVESFVRLMPMINPAMQKIDVYTHFFFVPNRLVWDNWEEFITGGEDGTANPVFPRLGPINAAAYAPGSLIDHLGCMADNMYIKQNNPNFYRQMVLSALPFRGYNLIHSEYYRDQNLSEENDFNHGDLNVIDAELTAKGPLKNGILMRCWSKDYFTSALPWPQRGPQVPMPIEGSGPVVLNSDGRAPLVRDGSRNLVRDAALETNNQGQFATVKDAVSQTSYFDPNGSLTAEFTNILSNINDLRRSLKVQEWLEKNARGGSRYIEQIFSHFGVRSSDARLQRPEYLGGGVSPVVISEVLQTSQTDTTALGTMGGHGISVGKSNSFRKFFEEHGYVFGIMSIMPRADYLQGIRRHLSKFDKFDYYFPEFAHLGEQEIKNKEIFYRPSDPDSQPEATFGYTPRYAEYKFIPNTCHGQFRSTLESWTLARKFDKQPVLNNEFVRCLPSERIWPVTDNSDKFIVDCFINLRAKRPMPVYGTPTF